MREVAILFAEKNSIYNSIAGCQVYDETRDARTFCGGMPVVAHPPCRLFSRLSHFSTAPESEKALAIFAIEQVRKNGGVLEHPMASRLWDEAGLPKTGHDEFGGWTLRVFQFWWGHQAAKDTLLYICGVHPNQIPEIPVRIGLPQRSLGLAMKPYDRSKKQVSKKERSATPVKFAEWLCELARRTQTPLTAQAPPVRH